MPRVFAAPGIDSPIDEFGILNSGAGQQGGPAAQPDDSAMPFDTHSNNPLWDRAVSNLIGNFGATKGIAASSIRVRRRGVSPFGGSAKSFSNGVYREKAGGTADMNPGADSHIAGGRGAAVTMVRLHGSKKANEGQKLPVLPKNVTRGGSLPFPAGGFLSGQAAPVISQVPGLPSIFKVLVNPSSVKGQ